MDLNKNITKSDNRNTEPLWINKTQLTSMVLGKEGQLHAAFREYTRMRYTGLIVEGEEAKYKEFVNCWGLIYELYWFLRYNKIETLKARMPEKYKVLVKCMDKYTLSQDLDHTELMLCHDAIVDFIHLAGYHEDRVHSGGSEVSDYDLI